MKTLLTIFLIANYSISTAHTATISSNKSISQNCPTSADISPAHLYGTWLADLDDQAAAATLVVGKHPEMTGSVSGTVTRNGLATQMAGDVDDGELTLEESQDGQHISATWLGTVVEGSCGKEIKGTWQAEGSPAAHTFILRKKAGWE